MTNEEKIKKARDIICHDCRWNGCDNDSCPTLRETVKAIELGLAEGRKEKELSYKVGKVTKAELNKCKTIEEKMEWLGKVLGYAIFKNDMNYAVWVNAQKNNIIEYLEKENEDMKVELNRLKSKEKNVYEVELKALHTMVDELEEENDELKEQNEDLTKRMLEQQVTIENLTDMVGKMKCCENCKHHYWNYSDLDCRLNYLCYNTNYDKWELAE